MAQVLFDNFNLIKDKLFSPDDVIIDNLIFRLQRTHTASALIIYSIILSISQYVGDPIDCIHQGGVGNDLIDTYCWVEGTWTKELNRMNLTTTEPYTNIACDPKTEKCWHHKYYQWVALVTVVLAGCFYLPRFFWQTWEDGKVKSLVSGLDKKTLLRGLQTKQSLDEGGEINRKIKSLIATWKELRGSNNAWAWRYYFCEVLNFLNIIAQFQFLNYFLKEDFTQIALKGLELDLHQSVLPILTGCSLETLGRAGILQTNQAMCVLPLNMINQKFLTILLIVLYILFFLNVINMMVRLITIVSSEIRCFILRYVYRMKSFNDVISKRSSHGDWLLLTFLLDNMNVVVSTQFMKELGEQKIYDRDLQ